MIHRGLGRTKEIARDAIGEDAVDLLRHAAIEAAQARLDVGHCDVQLGGGQSPGQGGIGVAVDQHQIRFLCVQQSFDGHQHLRSLFAVRSGTNLQVHIGLGNPQFIKKKLRHIGIVVLAGVHEVLAMPGSQLRRDRCGLDELRPRPDNGDDVERHEITL